MFLCFTKSLIAVNVFYDLHYFITMLSIHDNIIIIKKKKKNKSVDLQGDVYPLAISSSTLEIMNALLSREKNAIPH